MRKTNKWIVRFEVTFYGVDKEGKWGRGIGHCGMLGRCGISGHCGITLIYEQ